MKHACALIPSLCAALLVTTSAFSDSPKPGHHAVEFESTWDNTKQPYRLYVPESLGEGPAPLAVVLHGRGVDENAWMDLIPTAEAAEKHGYVVAAPYGRGNYWYRGAGEQDVLDIVHDVMDKLSIDPDRVHLAGHSMGGWGTAWIGSRNPGVFASIAPMAGWAPGDLLGALRDTPPFFIHDATDDIVPVGNSRFAVTQLGTLGISHQYREETEYAHASSMITDNFDRLFGWFDLHTLREPGRFPSFATRDPQRGGYGWLHVLELESFPSTGSVRVSPGAEGGLIVEVRGVTRLFLDFANSPHSAGDGGMVGGILRGSGGGEVEFAFDPSAGGGVLFERNASGGWASEAVSEFKPEYGAYPDVVSPWAAHLDDSDQVAFSDRWGRLLLSQLDADVLAVRLDTLRDQGWPLDARRVAATWCYPVEDLARFDVTVARLLEWRDSWDEAILVGDAVGDDAEESRVVTVVASMDIALRIIGNPGELLPLRPDELLVRAVTSQED